MTKKKKPVPYFKARISKRINNLSRAINKIDPSLSKKALALEYTIKDIKPGINTVKYLKNGVETTVRYDQIVNLSRPEQASLSKKLMTDRSNLRMERAFKQIQEKGKISKQFAIIAEYAEINKKIFNDILKLMLSQSDLVEKMTFSSFLNEGTKRNYWQSYQGRLKQLMKI